MRRPFVSRLAQIPVPRWVYQFRTYFASAPLCFALFCSYHEFEVDLIIWPLGLVIVLTGLSLRIWAQQHLHYRLKVHKRLTATGPYRFIRNPLYLGNCLICVGATVLSELFWMVPLTLLWCLGLYSLVIRYEEAHLLFKYGKAYGRYLEQVPRWVPRAVSFRNLQVTNHYFIKAVWTEASNLIIMVPFVIKEMLP